MIQNERKYAFICQSLVGTRPVLHTKCIKSPKIEIEVVTCGNTYLPWQMEYVPAIGIRNPPLHMEATIDTKNR